MNLTLNHFGNMNMAVMETFMKVLKRNRIY